MRLRSRALASSIEYTWLIVQLPAELTVMVTPSGLTQVPWVWGAAPGLVVAEGLGDVVEVGEGDGLGEEVGLGEGDGLGEEVGLGEGEGLGEDATTPNATLVVELLPAASVARASRLWLPAPRPDSGRLHELVPDAACHAPPSRATLTPVTPLLSEAVPDTVKLLLAVPPLDGEETSTVGATVSGLALPPPAASAGVTATRPRGRPRARAVTARRGVRTSACSTG
jgi:hypothetical protein